MDGLFDLVSNNKFSNCFHLLYQPRMYYGNVCNECFVSNSKSPLKRCSSCSIVYYCSKKHQVQDWSNHKKLCKNLKKVAEKLDAMKQCPFEDFKKCKDDLISELIESDEFAEQIRKFPWVCAVCFSRENLNFECEKCESVVYCSPEHREEDKVEHELNCDNLKLCKIFDSLRYENGFRLQIRKFVFEEIPRHVKTFPKNMRELSFLIQRQIRRVSNDNIQDMVNFSMHNDLYASAGSILYALEKIGLLQNRVFTRKPPLTKHDREDRLADRVARQIARRFQHPIKESGPKPAMFIHIVGASDYEVSFHWTALVGLLTHWMTNIDYIEFVLVGPALAKCEEPDFGNLEARSGYQCHPKPYAEVVKKLPAPDLVVLFNYGFNDEEKLKEFDNYETQRALFRLKKIPLVVTSTKQNVLVNYVKKLQELPGVKVQLDIHVNPFAESRPFRIWDQKNISTYVRNNYLAVLVRD